MTRPNVLRKAALMILSTGLIASAHHAFSSEFDSKKPVTLMGTVTKVDWKGPHVQYMLSVKNESGAQEQWTLEAANPDYLTKKGVTKDTFGKGKTVTVNGYRANNNARTASARVITDAAGKPTQVCDPAEDGGPAK
jgi:hypothetical protein